MNNNDNKFLKGVKNDFSSFLDPNDEGTQEGNDLFYSQSPYSVSNPNFPFSAMSIPNLWSPTPPHPLQESNSYDEDFIPEVKPRPIEQKSLLQQGIPILRFNQIPQNKGNQNTLGEETKGTSAVREISSPTGNVFKFQYPFPQQNIKVTNHGPMSVKMQQQFSYGISNANRATISQENGGGKSPITPSRYISLTEGFTRPPLPGETHPGGKDNNKLVLPLQVIQLHKEFIPSSMEVRNLFLKCFCVGFDKKGDKKELSEMSERRFNYTRRNNKKVWICEFDSLICKHSSHSNGGKLHLRFVLCDKDRSRICHVDSEAFMTITKRGLEKKMERQKRKREIISNSAKITHSIPSVGLTKGGQIVKIFGEGFSNITPHKTIVKFGSAVANEVLFNKRNCIYVETPKTQAGIVKVMISFDGVTYIKSDATFRFVDPHDHEGMNHLIQDLITS